VGSIPITRSTQSSPHNLRVLSKLTPIGKTAGSNLALHVIAAGLVLLSAPLTARAADTAVVLMYHRFGEDEFPSTSIRVEQFEAQLAHLRERQYVVVPLADVIEALTNGNPLPERSVAITIDDAYRSVYTVAFPMFEAESMPFTVFVSTDPVDEGLAGYMTWDQMREMAAVGAKFANHGAAHESVLARIEGEDDTAWLARVEANVAKGAARLAEELEPLAGAFAYPYGEYDTATGDLLRGLGYVSFGQQSGAVGPDSDLRALPRFPMAEAYGGMDQFPTKVASLPLPVTRLDPWDPVTTSRLPSIEVTLGDADARYAELACFVGGQGRVDVTWQEEGRRFVVGPATPLGLGRQRVNCTAPRNDGRYLWFSHQWIVQASE
jgi:poly-beta-1,6-N-acetyl-D-glucosamine N-deacetylase